MRNTIFTFIGVALLVGFVACDDWTSPEKLDVENEAVEEVKEEPKLDSMLVLKDILYHEWKDKQKNNSNKR